MLTSVLYQKSVNFSNYPVMLYPRFITIQM